tara:strand:- start:647 stop:895 length:249 start_codon:yes stop_codon:yes gene_type:complete
MDENKIKLGLFITFFLIETIIIIYYYKAMEKVGERITYTKLNEQLDIELTTSFDITSFDITEESVQLDVVNLIPEDAFYISV